MAPIPIKKFKAKIESPESSKLSFIRMPFDVKAVFGKGRVPVKLTVKGYTYRTTICHMGDIWGVPLRRNHRENAGVEFGDVVPVTVELDTEARVMHVPQELRKFLEDHGVWEPFDRLSYTHKKEFVEWIAGAKKEETREARKVKMIGMLKKKVHL